TLRPCEGATCDPNPVRVTRPSLPPSGSRLPKICRKTARNVSTWRPKFRLHLIRRRSACVRGRAAHQRKPIMAAKSGKNKSGFTERVYPGDAKTWLAFNLPDRKSVVKLAGFPIQCQPKGQQPYSLHNFLRFEVPGQHTQDAEEPPVSSINAPIHKFRWLH